MTLSDIERAAIEAHARVLFAAHAEKHDWGTWDDHPDGHIIVSSIAQSPARAWHRFEKHKDRPWFAFEQDGYQAVEIALVPVKDDSQ